MDDFLIKALIAGLGVAIVAGPLGAFVVWRKMSYFGETLAHSALLGTAIGLALGVGSEAGIIGACLIVALILSALQSQQRLANDTLLGILSHSTLALGLVAMTLLQTTGVDILSYLFGDILSVTDTDLVWIVGGGLVALAVLTRLWQPLLAIAIHEEMAHVEGVNVAAVRLIFMLIIALVIAAAMKVVGILLIMSLLIIPAASARALARSPEQMAVLASLLGCVAVAAGLGGAMQWNLPAGPAIVLAATALFVIVWLTSLARPGRSAVH